MLGVVARGDRTAEMHHFDLSVYINTALSAREEYISSDSEVSFLSDLNWVVPFTTLGYRY